MEHRLEVLLAEYSEFKKTQASIVRNRENLRLVAIAISGTVFGFALQESDNSASFRQLALYVVPGLTLQLGAVSAVLTRHVLRLHLYIKDTLAPRIVREVGCENEPINQSLLLWDSGVFQPPGGKFIILLDWSLSIFAYVMPGFIAQFLLAQNTVGFVSLYWFNWLLLSIATVWKTTQFVKLVRKWGRPVLLDL
jgi:hypothetical protein